MENKSRRSLEAIVLSGLWLYHDKLKADGIEISPDMFNNQRYRLIAEIILTPGITKADWEYLSEKSGTIQILQEIEHLTRAEWYSYETLKEFYIFDLAQEAGIDITGKSGIYTVDDFSDKIDTLYELGEEYAKGLSTGWNKLDEYYTCKKREMVVITGIPGSGKSEFMDALTVNLARQHGFKFAMFSPENFPFEEHSRKLIQKILQKPFFGEYRMTKDELDSGKEMLKSKFTFVMPNDYEASIKGLTKKISRLINEDGIDGVCLDPWNEIAHVKGNTQTETDYIGEQLSMLRNFVRINNIFLWIVAHPKKMYADHSGKYRVPELYDISGSAHWANKPDVGITIHRPNDDEKCVVYTKKIRNKFTGKKGRVTLHYEDATGIYSENPRYSTGANK